MDSISARRRVALDDSVVAAHEALGAATGEIGRVAGVLIRRIEELTLELADVRERLSSETSALEKRFEQDRLAAAQEHERETQQLRIALARGAAEWSDRENALMQECAALKEKLDKIYTTLT